MVQEGSPFLPSRRLRSVELAQHEPEPGRRGHAGAAPAGRLVAMRAAYTHGHVLRRQHRHADHRPAARTWSASWTCTTATSRSSSRQRMLDRDGNASNQVIWFIDARPGGAGDLPPRRFQVMDQWLANIRQHPKRSVAQNKPARAVDSCFTHTGAEIAGGPHVWDGDPRQPPGRRLHADLPAALAPRASWRAADARRRLQVRAAERVAGDRPRDSTALVPERRRARPARADLPDRGLRLHAPGHGPAMTAFSRLHHLCVVVHDIDRAQADYSRWASGRGTTTRRCTSARSSTCPIPTGSAPSNTATRGSASGSSSCASRARADAAAALPRRARRGRVPRRLRGPGRRCRRGAGRRVRPLIGAAGPTAAASRTSTRPARPGSSWRSARARPRRR